MPFFLTATVWCDPDSLALKAVGRRGGRVSFLLKRVKHLDSDTQSGEGVVLSLQMVAGVL